MGYSYDRGVGRGFGGLDESQIARLDAVVAAAEASAVEAEYLVPGAITTAWSNLIGAGSTTAAIRTNAAAAMTLYRTLKAKRDALANDPNATEYDVQVMEGSADAMSNKASEAAAEQLKPTTALTDVVGGTYRDIVGGASTAALWAAGAGVLALLVLASSGRRS